MIKMFCDGCGNEIRRNYVTERYKPTRYMRISPDGGGINVSLEVQVCVGSTWNSGHLCLPCLIRIAQSPECETSQRPPVGGIS